MTRLAHGMGVDLSPCVNTGLELLDPFMFTLFGAHTYGIPDLAADAEGALSTVPTSAGDRV